MQPFILIALVVFGLIVFGALIVILVQRSKTETSLVEGELHPQGYWISMGISIGAGFGVALGLVLDNLALGIAIGAGFGVAIGAAWEQQNKDKLRPITEQEKKIQKWGVALGLLILLSLLGGFLILFFLARAA